MHRRRFVSLVGTGLLGGVAGCSQGEDENEARGVRPVEIDIANKDDVPHEGTITLFRGGSTVFHDAWSFEAVKHKMMDGRIIEPPAYEPKLGDWSVRFRVKSSSNDSRIDLNSLPSTDQCVWLSIWVYGDESINYGASVAHDTCPLGNTTDS